MSDISVGHEEGNIACTIVLLKAMVGAGAMELPLVVEIALGSEDGWRRAAIDRLNAGIATTRRRRVKDAGAWEELNERWNWEERRS